MTVHSLTIASCIAIFWTCYRGIWALQAQSRKKSDNRFPTLPKQSQRSQGQILAVWILAAKLPNSDLNFAVDFWVDFPVFSEENGPKNPPRKARKIAQESVRKNSHPISAEAFS